MPPVAANGNSSIAVHCITYISQLRQLPISSFRSLPYAETILSLNYKIKIAMLKCRNTCQNKLLTLNR